MYHLQNLWLTYLTILMGAAAAPRPQETSATAASTVAKSASSTSTTVASSSTTAAPPTQQNACSEIAGMVAGENISQGVYIPAVLAWDCLQSVPIQSDTALPWLESMRPYIDWQSTLAYLADPPADYTQPPINLFNGLNAIISDVQDGKYTNEYGLEIDVYSLIHQAYDGHFDYIPNLLDKVFAFGRPLALVSYARESNQGCAKQYVYNDVVLSAISQNFEPSAITRIDDTDAVTYLENWSKTGVSQDPDALWNSVFFSLAAGSLGSLEYTTGNGLFAGGGNANLIYPGANTTITFENGTTTVVQNFAKVLQSFEGVQSGSDVFDKYVVPTTTTPYVFTPLPTVTQLPGYPSPIVIQGNGLDSGYYLDGEGYEDVAVLSIPTFEALDFSFGLYSGLDFSDAAYEFIDQAKADGKTKLIIDVSANGGGTISLGYTLFLKLFPEIVPYLGQRIRATDTIDIIGQTISSVIDAPGYNRTNRTTAIELGTLLSTPMDYQNDLDVNGDKFPSWPAKFGPHIFHDDNFTSIFRYNESTFDTTGIKSTRPFDVENVILLTDGNCASTCSIFAELLTRQAGVKTVVVGGRPNEEPMQALGATKGAQSIGWSNIYDWVNSTLGIITANNQTGPDVTVLEQYNMLPLKRASAASVNFRDQLRQGDADETPLQFVYEAADCRILNTKPMLINITALWKEVYDVAWGGKKCLVGSL